MSDTMQAVFSFLQHMGANEFRVIYSIVLISITIFLTINIPFPGSRPTFLIAFALITYSIAGVATENRIFFGNLSTEFLGAFLGLWILADDMRKEYVGILIAIGLTVIVVPDLVRYASIWFDQSTHLRMSLTEGYISNLRTDLLGAFVVFAMTSLRWRTRTDIQRSRRRGAQLDREYGEAQRLREDNWILSEKLRTEKQEIRTLQTTIRRDKAEIERSRKIVNQEQSELLQSEIRLREEKRQLDDIEARIKARYPDLEKQKADLLLQELAVDEEYYKLKERQKWLYHQKEFLKLMAAGLTIYESRLPALPLLDADEDDTEPAQPAPRTPDPVPSAMVEHSQLVLVIKPEGEKPDVQVIAEQIRLVFEVQHEANHNDQHHEMVVRPRPRLVNHLPCERCEALLEDWQTEAERLLARNAFTPAVTSSDFEYGKAAGLKSASEMLQIVLDQHQGRGAAAV